MVGAATISGYNGNMVSIRSMKVGCGDEFRKWDVGKSGTNTSAEQESSSGMAGFDKYFGWYRNSKTVDSSDGNLSGRSSFICGMHLKHFVIQTSAYLGRAKALGST